MTFTSPLPSVTVPASPLTPYILERTSRFADKAAFIDGVTGRTMTYGEFDDAVRRQAGGWLERGLAKGEVWDELAQLGLRLAAGPPEQDSRLPNRGRIPARS